MTILSSKLLRTEAMIVTAAALIATFSSPASARKLDCKRLWALIDLTEQQLNGLYQVSYRDGADQRKIGQSIERKQRSLAGLRALYDANCQPGAEAAEIVGGLIGTAILFVGSRLGSGGRGHGHGPGVQRGGSTRTTGTRGHPHW
jgi:hypothetical protein